MSPHQQQGGIAVIVAILRTALGRSHVRIPFDDDTAAPGLRR